MQINGIAHVILTVRNFEQAKPFYSGLLEAMGLSRIRDTEDYLYYVGARTAVGIRPASAEYAAISFDQERSGLHHVCFRARSPEDVDEIHQVVKGLGATVVHEPEPGPWVEGYYSVLFEDPDGIRLEVNYVPGRGVFEQGQAPIRG